MYTNLNPIIQHCLGKEVSSILEVVPKPPIAQTDDKVTTEGSKDEDELVCGNTDFMDTDYQSIDPEKVSDDLGLDKSDDLLTDELRNSIMVRLKKNIQPLKQNMKIKQWIFLT